MNIEYLRQKALSYAPEHVYPVVLDRDAKVRLQAAEATLAGLIAERDKSLALPPEARDADRTFADESPTVRLDARITEAESERDAARDAVRPDSLVLVFRQLADAEYRPIGEACRNERGIDDNLKLGAALISACYVRTESPEGEDVGLSAAEAVRLLDQGDRLILGKQLIGHHWFGAAISFDPRSSGRPATS